MTKKIYTLFLVLMLGGITAFAQNQIDSTQLNKQTQMTQDSLKKAQETNVKQTVPTQTTASSTAKKDTRPLSQKISFSLSTGFWINASSIYFEFSPMINYHFPKTYTIGTGPTYIYNEDRRANTSLNGWGGKIYGQAHFTRWLYGWTEYQGISNQHLTIESVSPYKSTKDYEYVDSWFLSLGISLHLGRKSFSMQALYDVLYKESTAYTYSPWTYRIGFGF